MTASQDGSIRVAYVAGWPAPRAPGLARYATELREAISRSSPAGVAGPTIELRPVDAGSTGARRLAWTQAVLPLQLARERPDVAHLTAPPVPLAWRGPTVLTIHDLSLVRLPGMHPRGRVAASGRLLRASARRAARLIVPSRATAADVIDLLRVDPDRVQVIPEAPAPWFRPVADPVAIDAVLARHGLRPGYILALGTLEPRKNLGVLLAAVKRLTADGADVPLVLAGASGWGGTQARIQGGPRHRTVDVRLLGRVPDADLPVLLSAAGAVAYPSLLEGFGLPVVEALACGAPVVTSDRGATAEVAGDAALLVDPTDPVALADALSVALTPGEVRERLRLDGPRRAAMFTWDAAATATMRVYALAADSTVDRPVPA